MFFSLPRVILKVGDTLHEKKKHRNFVPQFYPLCSKFEDIENFSKGFSNKATNKENITKTAFQKINYSIIIID